MTISIVADTVFCNGFPAGYPFRVMNFAKACRQIGLRVQLFLCNRNFVKRKDILWLKKIGPKINFFLIPPDLFYKRSFLGNLLIRHKSEIIQFENPEFVLNNLQMVVENQHKSIFILELHNLYYQQDCDIREFQILKTALHLVDYVICFSQFDGDKIARDFRLSRQKIIISPLFVNCRDYKIYGPRLDKDNILFIGNLFYKPNIEAANFLIKEVCPKLRKDFPTLHLHFVGNYPTKLFKKSTLWTFHGYVSGRKLDYILKETKICVAPLFSGYGARVKVLEYAAYGFPIIATSKAMHGLEKLKGVFIASGSNFSNQLAKYLKQQKLLVLRGLQNRRAVERYYEARKVITKLINQIISRSHLKCPKFRNKLLTMHQPAKIYFPPWLKEKRYNQKVLRSIYVLEDGKIKKLQR